MNRNETLTALETFLSIPEGTLIPFADEDTIGGFNFDPNASDWPVGSIWAVEGETLYALVRAFQPDTVLELGTNRGCSTSHLAAAVQRNGAGHVVAVDVWGGAGDLILPELRNVIEQRFTDALDAIASFEDGSLQFVFEDLLHGAEQVKAIIEALKPKLAPGAVVVHHDSEHGDDGVKVRSGITAAGVTSYASVLAAPSDCGLAVWRAAREHRINPELTLTKEELKGVIGGDTLTIDTNGEAKLNQRRAPDKTTRKPAAKRSAKK